jgi:hypothetical protein
VNKRIVYTSIAAVLFGTTAIVGDAYAAKGGIPGPPDGGDETAAQNLSVPAILVGSLGTLVCGADAENPSALVEPTGDPLTGYELPGDWWVQKVHTWQAECFNAPTAEVIGNWGDNLEGDAKLKVGSPIRVEIVLTNSTDFSATLASMDGYNVLKLQPSTLDRLSAYGHDAVLEGALWVATADQFVPAEWVVHDAGMQISVLNTDTGVFAVPLQPIAPEINATGKVVYGYNLRVSETGNYQIRFATTPAVTFTSCDVGVCEPGGTDAYLDIVVVPGGGQGGGKPQR